MRKSAKIIGIPQEARPAKKFRLHQRCPSGSLGTLRCVRRCPWHDLFPLAKFRQPKNFPVLEENYERINTARLVGRLFGVAAVVLFIAGEVAMRSKSSSTRQYHQHIHTELVSHRNPKNHYPSINGVYRSEDRREDRESIFRRAITGVHCLGRKSLRKRTCDSCAVAQLSSKVIDLVLI